MLGRIGAFLLFALFSINSYAAKDLILFIYASETSPHITDSDYSERFNSMAEFERIVQRANSHLNPQQRPEVLRLEVGDLKDVGSELQQITQQDDRYRDSRVKMILFGGHGNRRKFFLHDRASYSGTQVADIITSTSLQPFLAKDVGIYFSACNCGESLKPDTFQVEFMAQFKERNEKLESEKQTQSLVSIAHRYMSLSRSFNARSFGFDTLLYKAKVLKTVEDVNMLIFRKWGREALHNSSSIVGAAFFALATVLHVAVGTDAVSDSVRHLLFTLQGMGVGIGFLHSELKLMAYKWTQQLEYRANLRMEDSLHKERAAGNAVWDLVRTSLMTCEALF